MIHTLMLSGLLFGAFFELHTIPLDESAKPGPAEATTFFADADNDHVADLFILQDNKLTVVCRAGAVRETIMPQGVSAFDVADIDGDGVYEIIAIQGKAVLRMPLALQGDAPEPSTLFEADSLYAGVRTGPTPTVLVIPDPADAKKQCILLPTTSGTEVFASDGTRLSGTPYAEKFNRLLATNFSTDAAPRAADPTSIAISWGEMESMVAGDNLPRRPVAGPPLTSNTLTSAALRDAVEDDPINWPWFSVRNQKSTSIRAYCAIENALNTLIRTCDVAISPEGAAAGAIEPGPERRYPGALVPAGDEQPDFNGDGYADLLLWNAPQPGISVDSLVRAVVGRSWPITLTVHLYNPAKGRFEPAPATSLTYRIPVTWFLSGPVPLQYYVLRDFNGDKKTDLAMCTEENEYAIWLFSDGFAATPDERHAFPENIIAIEQTADVAANGKTSIVLRGDRRMYVLYAK